MRKRSWKWVLVFNIVFDLPLAVIISISMALLNKSPIVLFPNLLLSIVIGSALAFLINVILPVPLISAGFAGLFRIRPHTIGESLVGNLPLCLIFTAGLGLSLSAFNLFLETGNAPGMTFDFGAVWGSFTGVFLPLFAILYLVTFIMTPIAAICANKACGR